LKRALAALLACCALAAHTQTPPDTAPQPPAAAHAAPAAEIPAPETQAAPAPAAETQAAQPEAPRAPPAQAQPAPPPPGAKPRPPKPEARTPADERDALVAALRQEVNRLQSELDAERAAATQRPVDDVGPNPAQARGAWGWLAGAALLALAAGFVLGWRMLDRRIRRKYGGLRIY
jgi:hypothetical protein